MLTLEEAVKLFRKECIPKTVFTDQWEQEQWLRLTDASIKRLGLEKVLANKKYDYYTWEYVKTLI